MHDPDTTRGKIKLEDDQVPTRTEPAESGDDNDDDDDDPKKGDVNASIGKSIWVSCVAIYLKNI